MVAVLRSVAVMSSSCRDTAYSGRGRVINCYYCGGLYRGLVKANVTIRHNEESSPPPLSHSAPVTWSPTSPVCCSSRQVRCLQRCSRIFRLDPDT